MKNMKLWDWVVWNQRLKWKIIVFYAIKKKFFFSCVCINWFKSTKKDIKNVNLKLFTKVNRKDLEAESDVANWAQIFYKCDSEKQEYRQEFTPNAEYQQCRVFVQNDLAGKKKKAVEDHLKDF